jgi:hypothetical protein
MLLLVEVTIQMTRCFYLLYENFEDLSFFPFASLLIMAEWVI